MHILLYSDITEQAHHSMPPLQVSTSMVQASIMHYGTISYGLIQPSNLTKTKCSAIEQGTK